MTSGAIALAGFVILGATPSNAVDTAPAAPASEAAEPNEEITYISLQIDGFEIAAFNHLTSLTTEVGTPSTVVLRRALSSDLELSAWQEAVASGDPGARKSCSLIMYDSLGEPIARYWLEKAWPSQIQIRPGTATPVEVVTLTAEYFQRVSAS
jgi:hypothetical protein